MENHRIDQIFKEKLEGFEKNPPVGLLDQINQQIIFRGRVRRMTQLKTVIGIAAALVLVLMAGWFSVTSDQFSENRASLPAVQPEISVKVNASNTPSLLPKTETSLLALQKNSGISASKQQNSKPKVQPVQKQSTVLAEAATPNEEKALQNAPKESVAPTVKDEFKSSTPPNTNQKKKEPLYFTDSQYTPAISGKNQEKGSWRIKAEISPMMAQQNQSGGTGGTTNTKSVSTVSGGMIASYKLTNKISISSGIRYSQMKQGTHSDYTMSAVSGITYLQPVEKAANISSDISLNLPSVSSIVYSNGMKIAGTNVFASDISQEFKYLEIPIQATYKVLENRLSVGVTGGVSTNILVGNRASITENGILLSQGNTENLRNVIYSGSAGVEFGYELGKNLVLTVEPRIKQYMHSVSSNDLINFKPLQLGIFTGITYSFNY